MKLVQFGAGNIGRSFIGQLFCRAGWDVVFVDVNETLIQLLNEKRYYKVVIKQEGKVDEVRLIGPVRALNGRDSTTVANEVATADLIATSVGKGALPSIMPMIALGLKTRYRNHPKWPLDIIIAENAPGANQLFRENLNRDLGPAYPLEELVGLVETSIGKMVPIMRAEDLAQDPLQVFAEAYENLILDKRAFRGPLPMSAEKTSSQGQTIQWPKSIELVDDISAYIARKLFIHNLGHAAVAYTSFELAPNLVHITDGIRIDAVRNRALAAMNESAEALLSQYPQAFSRKDLEAHIKDLLERFENRALGDTVYRVGRDLYRKLDRDDRLVGAMRLCAKHNLPFSTIAQVYRSALTFSATDETGRPYPQDEEFRKDVLPQGIEAVLREVSHLNPEDSLDRIVMDALR
ncbi:mannitol-1-phosphate 5-dehydrogenase [Gracilinema caldarium]|uniref:Mannitol-1-phosphate 5-dehydrogenase n=1 Tax=Gracilinema caldarium (strain ATCC 51460 / DSM 7334 / H1) TaxID=744872 RepID=F8EWR1_GRAC1|nr:mannitol-1-phosphate 5-dehydrogenase [Gracilinema caldarium]AEJ18297.1 Mannitol-1-phosphate 5-dehydrogenase [Gracilinema caldarium DSM 7334]